MRRMKIDFYTSIHSLPLTLFCFLLLLVLAIPGVLQGAVYDWAEGRQDLADGASRDYYNRAAQLEWKYYLGDWCDAENVEQGGVYYTATTIQDTDTPRYIQWDVTGLVQEWVAGKYPNQGFFVDAISGGGPMNFRSKEFSTPEQQPELVVEIDGELRVFKPVADTYLEPSTYRSMGDSELLRLSTGGSNVLLRFDLKSIDSESEISSATLKLFSHAQYGSSSMVVGIFRSAQGDSIDPIAPHTGIAAKYKDDKGIENHPEVIFATGFEAENWPQEWSSTSGTIEVVGEDPIRQFTPFQNKALRAKMPEGENSSMSVIYKFFDKTGVEPEEVYFRYYLRFADDWDQTVFGGKLPGISGTYGRAGWGGRKPDGTDGWSARGTYFLTVNGVNPLSGTTPIGTYCYYADQPGVYGDTWTWSQNYKGYLVKNRWYSIEQYVRMNTPGVHDGIIRAWVDGVPAFEKTDIMFRTVDSLKIEQIWMNVYHGGTAVSPYDQHLYFDNIVIARDYIGPIGQASPSSLPWNLLLLLGNDK